MAVKRRMLRDRLTERVMLGVARSLDRLRRLEPHVVPAEIFKITANLAETLGTHGRTSRTLAGEQVRKRGKRMASVRTSLTLPPY